jgi:hypothetical protein
MRNPSGAFLLGLLSFVLMMFISESRVKLIGETMGLLAAFASLAVYFFICQFLRSRGNPDALRTDWRIMLTLGAVPFVSVVIMVLVERRDVILAQGPGILLACCGGTFAGAFAASRAARRATVRK